jgi:hypothetical protein
MKSLFCQTNPSAKPHLDRSVHRSRLTRHWPTASARAKTRCQKVPNRAKKCHAPAFSRPPQWRSLKIGKETVNKRSSLGNPAVVIHPRLRFPGTPHDPVSPSSCHFRPPPGAQRRTTVQVGYNQQYGSDPKNPQCLCGSVQQYGSFTPLVPPSPRRSQTKGGYPHSHFPAPEEVQGSKLTDPKLSEAIRT